MLIALDIYDTLGTVLKKSLGIRYQHPNFVHMLRIKYLKL